MYSIVATYPMTTLHQSTQRLAIGNNQQVVIYDVKAAQKLYVLDGHTTPVTAVSFSADGKYLATYSHDDATVRFWNTAPPLWGFSTPPRCICGYSIADKFESKYIGLL
jgi:WD40 repeat protein